MPTRKRRSTPKGSKGYTYVVLVGTSVVLFWRGIWGLLDHFFFPGEPLFSYGLSLLIGLSILFFTHTMVDELL